MSDSKKMDDLGMTVAVAAHKLEMIEDELRHVKGMGDFRERITEVRTELVEAGIEDAVHSFHDNRK